MKSKILKPFFGSLLLSFTSISSTFALNVCFVDDFGEIFNLSIPAYNSAGNVKSLTGTADFSLYGAGIWNVTGTVTKSTKTIYLDIVNPNPDNCITFSDEAWDTWTYSSGTYNITGSWYNDCNVSGTLTATGSIGGCSNSDLTFTKGDHLGMGSTQRTWNAGSVARVTNLPSGTDLAELFQSGNNAMSDFFSLLAGDESKNGMSERSAIKTVCFEDDPGTADYGYVWSITGTNTGGGVWILSGTVDVMLGTDWIISGTGNSKDNTINMTATNPDPDFCLTHSDYFTYTGTVSGTSLSGSWVNDCTLSGDWSGSYTGGSCEPSLVHSGNDGGATSTKNTQEKSTSLKAYPNPLTDNTTISYSLQQNDLVRVTIYDHLGQEVKVLVSESEVSGTHSVNWNATDMAGTHVKGGLYLIRVETTKGAQSQFISVNQ